MRLANDEVRCAVKSSRRICVRIVFHGTRFVVAGHEPDTWRRSLRRTHFIARCTSPSTCSPARRTARAPHLAAHRGRTSPLITSATHIGAHCTSPLITGATRTYFAGAHISRAASRRSSRPQRTSSRTAPRRASRARRSWSRIAPRRSFAAIHLSARTSPPRAPRGRMHPAAACTSPSHCFAGATHIVARRISPLIAGATHLVAHARRRSSQRMHLAAALLPSVSSTARLPAIHRSSRPPRGGAATQSRPAARVRSPPHQRRTRVRRAPRTPAQPWFRRTRVRRAPRLQLSRGSGACGRCR